MKTKSIMALFLSALVLCLVACGTSAGAPASEASQAAEATGKAAELEAGTTSGKVIGFCATDTSNSFVSWFTNDVKDRFAEDGVEVQIANAENDSTTQISQIENFTTMKVDLIIAMLVDTNSSDAALQKAQDNGIKVMVIDSPGEVFDATIYSDRYEIGEMIANKASEWVNATFPDAEDGSIEFAILDYRANPGFSKQSDGMATITEINPKVTVVGTYGEATTNDYAQTAIENCFQANPGLKGVLCFSMDGALGVNTFVTRPGSPVTDKSQFGVFSADFSEEGVAAIKKSLTDESVVRATVKYGSDDLPGDIYALGNKILKGEEYERINTDPLTVVDETNVENY